MSELTHVEKLYRAFAAMPDDFTPDDLDRVIETTLAGVPLDEWEDIADAACDRCCDEGRDKCTLFLAAFHGTMH